MAKKQAEALLEEIISNGELFAEDFNWEEYTEAEARYTKAQSLVELIMRVYRFDEIRQKSDGSGLYTPYESVKNKPVL